MERPKKAVILAGGLGTRLRPVTYEIPKSLIPVHGRTLTEHILDLLKKYEVNEVVMTIGYLREKIKDYFKDGKQFGVKMSYVEEDKPLGTAGALSLLKDKLDETFVVMNGDNLIDIDVEDMFNKHKRNKALITIALNKVEDVSQYGVARLKGERITEFVEKPKKEEAPSNLINSGIYIIEKEVLDMINKGFCMFETDIFPKIAKKGRLYGYEFKGQWFDSGTFERWEKILKEWKGIR
jgi:mannose-1-phosphate guanylyltransferase